MAKYRLVLKDSSKTKRIPQDKLNYFKEHGFLNYCKVVTINLKDLVKKYGLDNPSHGMFGRRTERWGDQSNFVVYEDNKDNNWNSPITLNAEGAVQDGLHRLYALWKDGYDSAEVLQVKPYDTKNRKYIDSDFDYGTGEVRGSDIFDLSTTGTLGSWQDLLKGIDTDYYKNKKNLKGQVVQMSPNEYYRECAKMFRNKRNSNTTSEDLKTQRRRDNGEDYIEDLKDVIIKKKKKFPICVLDISYDAGQEGLHRMMAAGDLFGWDKKFPVLLVETYDKARQERLEKGIAQREFTYKMDDILKGLKRYDYYDLEEFYKMLSEKIEYWFEQTHYVLTENGNNLEVQVYSDEIDDSLIYNINLNEIEVEEK